MRAIEPVTSPPKPEVQAHTAAGAAASADEPCGEPTADMTALVAWGHLFAASPRALVTTEEGGAAGDCCLVNSHDDRDSGRVP